VKVTRGGAADVVWDVHGLVRYGNGVGEKPENTVDGKMSVSAS
jgi:hypothetical protein